MKILIVKGSLILTDLTDEIIIMGDSPVGHAFSDVWKGTWEDPVEQRPRVVSLPSLFENNSLSEWISMKVILRWLWISCDSPYKPLFSSGKHPRWRDRKCHHRLRAIESHRENGNVGFYDLGHIFFPRIDPLDSTRADFCARRRRWDHSTHHNLQRCVCFRFYLSRFCIFNSLSLFYLTFELRLPLDNFHTPTPPTTIQLLSTFCEGSGPLGARLASLNSTPTERTAYGTFWTNAGALNPHCVPLCHISYRSSKF